MKNDELSQSFELKNDVAQISPKNALNDLTGKEWIILSKSFWFQKGLGIKHADTEIEREHPAPFSFQDIEKLIRMFTKPKMTVFDPFCGIASTLKAAAYCNRNAIGIEISSKWVKLGKERLKNEIPGDVKETVNLRIVRGDCLKRMPNLADESIDFIVTSPPYWGILNKNPSHKIKNERIKNDLATKYSQSSYDLGNIPDYKEFLNKLGEVAKECYRILKSKKYFAIIVGDFYHKSKFYPFHIHAENVICKAGFNIRGINILAQNNKKLYPYGYPYSFIQNIHHQYILIFQKP
jgi:DNA modification methylase